MFKWGLLVSKFRRELILMWHLLRDARTPVSAKFVALAAALYIISPIDLVSDFLPVLGWIDDGIVALILMKVAQRLLPPDLLASLKAKMDTRQTNQKGA